MIQSSEDVEGINAMMSKLVEAKSLLHQIGELGGLQDHLLIGAVATKFWKSERNKIWTKCKGIDDILQRVDCLQKDATKVGFELSKLIDHGSHPSKPVKRYSVNNVETVSSSVSNCCFCHENSHLSRSCTNGIDPDQKVEIIRSMNLCLTCLNPGHYSRNCRQRNTIKCDECQGRHATVLHNVQFTNNKSNSALSQRRTS